MYGRLTVPDLQMNLPGNWMHLKLSIRVQLDSLLPYEPRWFLMRAKYSRYRTQSTGA